MDNTDFRSNRFFLDYSILSIRYEEKVSKLKLYLPRQKLTINETLIFFKIGHGAGEYTDCIFAEG